MLLQSQCVVLLNVSVLAMLLLGMPVKWIKVAKATAANMTLECLSSAPAALPVANDDPVTVLRMASTSNRTQLQPAH